MGVSVTSISTNCKYKDDQAKYDAFSHLCWSTPRFYLDTSFVFVSPYFLVHHDDALKTLLHVAEEQTLRNVCLDEVHPARPARGGFPKEVLVAHWRFFPLSCFPTPDRSCTVRFLGTSVTALHS